MKKHAFLILAHDNPKVLSFLLSQLDDERNDIYIHINANSLLDPLSFYTRKATLFFIKRTICYWGEYSIINATLRLVEEACKRNNYKYLHLLSGTTLCTKTQNEIHSFYDKTDLEFFHINTGLFESIQKRCKYYYPFINTNLFRRSKFLKASSLILGKAQFIFCVNRIKNSPLYPFYNGMSWFSITDDFARYLLKQEPLIKKTFNHTLASDEIFVQTVAMHSAFKTRVYGYNEKDDFVDASKTYQLWGPGKSTYLDTTDKIITAKNDDKSFFARKFNDNNIVEISRLLSFED